MTTRVIGCGAGSFMTIALRFGILFGILILLACSPPDKERVFCEDLQFEESGKRYSTTVYRGQALDDLFWVISGDRDALSSARTTSTDIVAQMQIQRNTKTFELILVNNMFDLRRNLIEPSKERSVIFANILLTEMSLRDVNVIPAYACIRQEFMELAFSNWR